MEPAQHLPLKASQLVGWLPVEAYADGEQLRIVWNRLDGQGLHEPFFADSCARLRRRPFNIFFSRQSSMEDLVELASMRPGLSPKGFIFHSSRCGSTLVSQMLAATKRNLVVSEAAPLDALLQFRRFDPAVSTERRMQWLQAMVCALGQAIQPEMQQLFIKFDSWNILDLPLIRAAFPNVPWVFIYREPLEVLASHMRQRGIHMVPGMLDSGLFGLTREQAVSMPAEDYCARVLGWVCSAALQHIPSHGGMAVNYTQLPQALETTVAAWFGVEWQEAERVALRSVALRDAKNPRFAFSPDQEQKRQNASPLLQAAVTRWAAQSYYQLENLRTRDSAPASKAQ